MALKVAMGWARAAVRLHQQGDDAELDHRRIEQALDRLRRSLEKVSTIKGTLTTATKATNDGRGHLEAFADEVEDALDELDRLICGVGERTRLPLGGCARPGPPPVIPPPGGSHLTFSVWGAE